MRVHGSLPAFLLCARDQTAGCGRRNGGRRRRKKEWRKKKDDEEEDDDREKNPALLIFIYLFIHLF